LRRGWTVPKPNQGNSDAPKHVVCGRGAHIEDQDGTVLLEVQVLKGIQNHKVLVDAKGGQVAKIAPEDGEENGESEGE
jgi:hypothetical protein